MDNYFMNHLDEYMNEDDMAIKNEIDVLAVDVYEKATNRPILSDKDITRRKVSSRRKKSALKYKQRLNKFEDKFGVRPMKPWAIKEHQCSFNQFRWPNIWNESTANHRKTVAANQQLRECDDEIE